MKNCLECGDAFAGREDKKFCCDCCRNSYNNKINKDTNNFMRNINNTLRKNYRILSEINTNRKTKTTRELKVILPIETDKNNENRKHKRKETNKISKSTS